VPGAWEVSEETTTANGHARSGFQDRPTGRSRNRTGAPGNRCPFVLPWGRWPFALAAPTAGRSHRTRGRGRSNRSG
jgi:hypothetical protein